jgi:SAM-dependent methyltransferase
VEPPNPGAWDRDAELEAIRTTYAGYDRTDRARLWDTRVPGYGRLASDLQRRLLQALEASLPPGRPAVVDLGCGDGALAADVGPLARGLDWIGVDLRPESIEIARGRFPELAFQVASADAVPLASGSVDVVIARLLFSSLSPDLEVAVANEIRRLLRPEGWLVWLDLRYSNPANRAVHGLSLDRIHALFDGWRRELRTAGLLPPLARRLGPTAGVTYPVLAAVPMLRSHIVGRLQRPPDPA